MEVEYLSVAKGMLMKIYSCTTGRLEIILTTPGVN